jgi:hypothetical protein
MVVGKNDFYLHGHTPTAKRGSHSPGAAAKDDSVISGGQHNTLRESLVFHWRFPEISWRNMKRKMNNGTTAFSEQWLMSLRLTRKP